VSRSAIGCLWAGTEGRCTLLLCFCCPFSKLVCHYVLSRLAVAQSLGQLTLGAVKEGVDCGAVVEPVSWGACFEVLECVSVSVCLLWSYSMSYLSLLRHVQQPACSAAPTCEILRAILSYGTWLEAHHILSKLWTAANLPYPHAGHACGHMIVHSSFGEYPSM
jgi:hypothetical protein